MKKLLLSLLLINIFAINVNAETYTGNTSISLAYDKEPTYSVKIPKVVDVSSEVTNFNYYVSGDIYADQSLQVLFDQETTIYSSNSSCKVYISQDISQFAANQLTDTYVPYKCRIIHNKLESGKWFGSLNVVISLIGGA